MEFGVLYPAMAGLFNFADSIRFIDTGLFTQVTTPFLSLAPQIPRVVDIPYAAMALSCVDQTDISDGVTTDASDVTDGEGEIII